MEHWEFDSSWFEEEFTYQGHDLGVTLGPDSTTWKVWSPSAVKIKINLYATGSDQEDHAEYIGTLPLAREDHGVWSLRLDRPYPGLYYTYTIEHPGYKVETEDLYSHAVGVDGKRSMIVDLNMTNPFGWEKDRRIHIEAPTDAIIWETHVKDFSAAPDSGMIYKGKYLAFTEKDTHLSWNEQYPTGVNYLKQLGITHVQLMPVFDFATVEESRSAHDQYNWGYDPLHFNVPEGSYSTDPWHGEVRIREMKRMVQSLHEEGIGVIMDVVYNHTYHVEDSIFHKTVPYYYHRMNDHGAFSNGSGCGNEVASERSMCRQYILDSIRYWVEEYHIDGFRFDLMGVLDIETMNQIRAMLDAMPDGKSILMYGEPWSGGAIALNPKFLPADKIHARKLHPRIGIFHDEARDGIKGSAFLRDDPGFINGAHDQAWKLRKTVKAWSGPQMTVRVPSQTITYCSAHDNFTLWDKLVFTIHPEWMSYDDPVAERIMANKLAAAIVLTSQGTSFMQSGEEFARTKYGDGNSYRSETTINQLDWKRQIPFAELVRYYQDLIWFRKKYKALHDPTEDSMSQIYFSIGHHRAIAYTLPLEPGADRDMIAVVINASHDKKDFWLETWSTLGLPDYWEVLFDRDGLVRGEPMRLRADEPVWIPGSTAWILGSPKRR